MCIIQIWTTSTGSSAPKLFEKLHVCSWVNFYVPCKRWEWNSNIWASWLGRKDWETWFFNSCNSKTRVKIMNLAWSHDMAPRYCGNFFGQIATSFGVILLQTGASLKKAPGSERERVTSVCETTYVHCLLLPSFFYTGWLDQIEVAC